MPIRDVHSIELDQSVWGKAVIVWRRKDGSVAKKVSVKWNQRYEAFRNVHKAWFEKKFVQSCGDDVKSSAK